MNHRIRHVSSVLISYLLTACLLTGCVSNTSYAPVTNAQYQPPARQGFYRVKRGDTLYSIAWANGLDYRQLARWNRLRSPYSIQPNQLIKLTGPVMRPRPAPTKLGLIKIRKFSTRRAVSVRRWLWPARGKIIQGFSLALAGNKGIDIRGRYGEPVKAAAAGRVVYSGVGVRGYGNLILVKHNDDYISAYAFNRSLLVRLGQRIRAGQEIATMGRNNAGKVMLHFEIRRNGKPVNPLHYLR